MKIYLAARYESHPVMREWRRALESLGQTVTSRWINGTHEIDADCKDDRERMRFAIEDLEDIDAADVLVAWNPREVHRSGRGGRHVEVGYALAKGKPVVLIGERENVFHWHESVTVKSSFDDFLASLIAEVGVI